MTRSFSDRAVDPLVLEEILTAASRVPSAGSAQGFDFLVLEGAEQVARYWKVTLPHSKRESFPWPGLLRAPVLAVVYADGDAYVGRYSEPDKSATGLGGSRDDWSTPYWLVDASFAAMAMQLAAIDRELGVLFFGVFEHAAAVAAEFGVPAGREVVGTIAIGHPDGLDEPSRSASRNRRGLSSFVHRGDW